MRRFGTLGAILVLLAPLRAGAVSVGAMPALIVMDSAPGASSEEEVTVMNGTDAVLLFTPAVRDFGIDEKGHPVVAGPGTLPGSAAAWISFVPKQLRVPPRGKGKFKVIVSVPPNATGGHYALLDFDTIVDVPVPDTSSVRVGAGVSIKLMHAVIGRTSPKVQVGIARLLPPTASDRMEAVLRFVNQGDVHVKPSVEMVLLDSQRKLVGRTESAGGGMLLPGQVGDIRVTWGGELADGEYLAVFTVVLGSDSQVIERRLAVGSPAVEARAKKAARK